MAVFPENMDKLDTSDPAKSLSIIENYIRYMGERIEFSLRNVTKTVTAAGVSSAEMYVLLTAQANALSALQSTVNGLSGTLTSLSNQVGGLNENVSSMEKSLAEIRAALSALEARVTALETNNDGG